MRANREVLGAAIAELIENAITFVAPGTVPTVCIWAQEDGDVVRLCVRDNGIGIPLEYQDKVFGVFERLRQSEEDRGTGIGLAVVYKSMVRMGGKAGLESAPGEGSRFWLELLAWRESEARTLQPAPQQA